jgi:tellurite resistance protein
VSQPFRSSDLAASGTGATGAAVPPVPLVSPVSGYGYPGVAMRSMRIPPNLFSIPFGLVGLAAAWRDAQPIIGVPAAAADAIFILAAAVWLVMLAAYAVQGPQRLLADLRDPVQSPFLSLAVMAPLLLSAALAATAFTAGRVLVIVFLALTIVVGGWLTGQWIAGSLDQDKAHPGYFLPTVAGGLAGAYAAAVVHLNALAQASFGIGIICWALLGSTILYRLFFRPALPDPLAPALAIEVAPPAVAGFAYFALNGGRVDFPARILAGYVVLMVLVQLRFVPVYRRLRFSPGFWGFTFSYAAVTVDALLWIRFARPPGGTGYAIALVTLITRLHRGDRGPHAHRDRPRPVPARAGP